MTHLANHKNVRSLKREEPLATVPKVRLYVERPDKQEAWFVNVGHVEERGRWRTEPHAHPAYGQVIFVRNGRGVMNLEGSAVPFQGPCALLLPTECVHGLDYEIDVDRWVITIEATYLAQVNAKFPEFLQLWSSPRVTSLTQEATTAAEFLDLIQRLNLEIRSKTLGHVVGMEAILTLLLLMLARGSEGHQDVPVANATPTATRLVDFFRELIDQHYRENLTLQTYMSMMGVSPTQLRAACASATGQSPNKMIHARIITEAKRSLIFGDMAVEQIAYWLGFTDAAYFTRFFRKEVGQSPSQFRSAARHQTHSA